MPLAPGDQFGPYEILAPLGAGGMGQVYRARDPKLNREVAIKVLPPALAGDPQYMARFEREAQTLASLNHPNIATVYGIEQGALVMELVAGDDLRGPVPVDEAIAIARQIAEGLEAAHERGIVHRDLKPANIKLTPEGVVKLLDFGLAKTLGEFNSAASGSNPTISPTLPLTMTQAGTILGTAAYMSPEQARGKYVDRRTDIWSFGVVLHELLTGKRPFGDGETFTDTLALVMTTEPDWKALPANTPPRVRRLLERCLRRDPKLRLRDIGEARVLLGEPELDEPEAIAPSAAPASNSRLPWMLAAVFALCTLTLAVLWLRPKAAEPRPGIVRFQVPLPPGTTWPGPGNNATHWTLSPDGRSLAIIALENPSEKNVLWVRPLNATSAHRMDNTEGAMYPFWSPDGQSIGFFADGKLKRVSLSGGNVQTTCQFSGQPSGGAWGQDGSILYASEGALMRVNAMGGIPQPATTRAKDEVRHSWPQLLPDGRHFLYLSESADPTNNAIYVQEPGSAKRVRVLQNLTRAMWSPPGYLLFVREGTLFAQRMDLKTFQVEGEAQSVVQDVRANEANGRSAFAVSQNGVLVYRGGSILETSQLTWRDRDGKVAGTVGPPGRMVSPVLSPDEKSVAVLMGDADLDAWIIDLRTGSLTRASRNARATVFDQPVWSPDSQRLAVAQAHAGIVQITLASGQVLPLINQPARVWDWSPDGSSILCSVTNAAGRFGRLSLLAAPAGTKFQTILDTPDAQGAYRFSPDGHSVAYASGEFGSGEIYVASFPSFAFKHKVSTGVGSFPLWVKGGKEIVYRSSDRRIMTAEIHIGATVESGVPKPLFQFGGTGLAYTRFAVTADGTRFLIVEPAPGSDNEKPELSLVLNWAAEMKEN